MSTLPIPTDTDDFLRTQGAPGAETTHPAGRPVSGARRFRGAPLSRTLTILADLLALSLAFESARRLRLSLGGVLFARLDAEMLAGLIPPLWLVLTVWLISAWWARLYRPRKGLWRSNVVVHVVESMGLATALTIVLSFVLYENGSGLSRAFLVLLFLCGVVLALIMRVAVWLTAKLNSSTARPVNVLVVGGGEDTRAIIEHLTHAPEGHVALRGLIATGDSRAGSVALPVLGTIRDLRRAINETRAERVIVVDTEVPVESLAECIDVCTGMSIPLNCTGGGLTRFSTVVEVGEVAGVRLLEVRRPEFERTQDFVKRATDVIVAASVLLAVLPLWVALSIAIKLSSPGPVVYVSDRVGRGGRHFRCLKFRSMVPGAEALRATVHHDGAQDGHLFKAPNDARVTAVGRFMRRLSLDELPQLWNVVRGDMSLVGPRPLPAVDLGPDGLSLRYPAWSVERSTVRPGLTGLWQVRGRSELSFDEMVRLDLLYVRTRNYQLDLQILIETIPAVLLARGAM